MGLRQQIVEAPTLKELERLTVVSQNNEQFDQTAPKTRRQWQRGIERRKTQLEKQARESAKAKK